MYDKLKRRDTNLTLFYYLSLTASFTADTVTLLKNEGFVLLLQVQLT